MIVLVALLAGCGWTNRQKTMAVVVTAALAVDWHQTHDVISGCTEINPVIGSCGENAPINLYFPMVMMTILFAADRLPEFRELLLGGLIGVEGSTIWRNQSLGHGPF